MDYLVEALLPLVNSNVTLLAFIIPIINEGICHWIDLTSTKNRVNLKAPFRVLSIVAYIYLISQNYWLLLILSISFERLGIITIPPLLDLHWNKRHYGNPCQSFFLNEENTLGPSRQQSVEEKFQIYGINFQFRIPPLNIYQGWTRDIQGVTDESKTKKGKYLQEIKSINEWRKYFWSIQSKRYTKQALFPNKGDITLSIIEVEVDEPSPPEKNIVESILTELILRHSHTDDIVEIKTFIELPETQKKSINGIKAITIHFLLKERYFDTNMSWCIFQKSPRRFIVFQSEDRERGLHGRFILEQLVESLKLSSMPQKNDGNAFFEDLDIDTENIRQLVRKIAQRKEVEKAKQIAIQEEIDRESEIRFNQIIKEYEEAKARGAVSNRVGN